MDFSYNDKRRYGRRLKLVCSVIGMGYYENMEFSFKMKEKEEEGGGNEGCRFWFIREDSEYFKMDGEEFIEKELDCKLSEKYNYVCKLDDYWDEVNKKFGVKEEEE